jgi:hypothetical protein
MTSRLRSAWHALVLAALAALIAGCTGTATPPPTSSPPGAPLSEAAAKLALFDRFGPLVYCDPDEFPVARVDQASAALAHLAEMQADPIWPLLARRVGFSVSQPPGGDQLLAAYSAWKMARALVLTPSSDGWSFDARFAGTGSDATQSGRIAHVAGTINTAGIIQVTAEEASAPPPCPICLARGTTIATPAGEVAVETLRPGDPVWTVDGRGRRIAGVVVEVGSMPVPPGHQVVKLVLGDGRIVRVSPGHPLPDGRAVGSLRAGDGYDGSVVLSAERVAYDGGRTFDLLPSGPTGVYWANGIELGSTLFR